MIGAERNLQLARLKVEPLQEQLKPLSIHLGIDHFEKLLNEKNRMYYKSHKSILPTEGEKNGKQKGSMEEDHYFYFHHLRHQFNFYVFGYFHR